MRRATTSLSKFLASAVVLAMCAGGCTSVVYDSNPEGPPSAAEEDPDYASSTVQNLLATSIRWAVESHPPPPPGVADDGWFAINLPRGVTRKQYIAIAERISDRAAPITPDLGPLPTYHVGWVWMRGDNARVDVARPVYSLARDGEPVYQTTTLHLRRRFASWSVERTQPWRVGVVDLPPVYYIPTAEEPEAPVYADQPTDSDA